MTTSSSVRRALLIGIRSYPAIPEGYGTPLAGCHNDVAAVHDVLADRGFDDVRVLVDRLASGCECSFCADARPIAGEPTRDGIFEAVDALVEDCRAGDIVALYYSGHGSEYAGGGVWAGQRFQTIVPVDSGRGDFENRDIADREMRQWWRAFATRDVQLTVLFDCCHSGGMSDLRGAAQTDRRVLADDRSGEMLAPGLRRAVRHESASAASKARSGDGSAIILSASAAHELSAETAIDGRKHGLFTHHLTSALASPEGRAATRWSTVFPGVAAAVNAENLGQHPRRQGDGPIFTTGPIDPDDVDPPDVIELRKLAVVIGVDYRRDEGDDTPSFPALRTPVDDARAVAEALRDVQGYEIVGLSQKHEGPLLGAKATRRRIHKVIHRLAAVKAKALRESAVVIYFAGHGVVRSDDQGNQVGYLVPADADPDDPSTWLAMQDLRDQLVDGIDDAERLERLGQRRPLGRLTSRHLLLVLDCCFGGALAYDFFRGDDTPDRPIYYSEYRRFVEGTAWQLLSSASFDQQALDRDPRDPEQPHSPFARALIEGLTSDAADQPRSSSARDHIVTASELHQHIDASLRAMGVEIQSPGLTPLRPNNGEFVFHVPGFRPSPLPDPPLDPTTNPWRGGDHYTDPDSFYGREQATLDLLDGFLRRAGRPLAVVGPTGSGASSLIEAGLLPILDDPRREQQRLLAWAQRRSLDAYLISADDLTAVRSWIAELALNLDADPDQVAETIRAWAVETDLLDASAPDAGQVQATISREQVGMPSFDDSDQYAFLRRLGILRLHRLGAPELLVRRLRLWAGEGGVIDFLCGSPREIVDLVGSWRIVDDPREADGDATDDPRPLVIVDPASGTDRAAIESDEIHDAVISLTGHEVAAVDPTGWQVVEVPRPSRDELREAIEGPAAERVLVFEPSQVVDAVIDDIADTPAPWPLLSLVLSRAYERAWERRGSSERTLSAADLPPTTTSWRHPAGPIAEQAEAAYRCLADRRLRRTARHLLLRAVHFDLESPGRPAGCRPVSWRELDMADGDERRRLGEVLDAFVAARALVAGRDHVELGHRRLLDSWPRLRRWLAVLRRAEVDLQAVWHRALAWEAGGFRTEARRGHDVILARLLDSAALGRLEWAMVAATELTRRRGVAEALAAQTTGKLFSRWPDAIRHAIELAELSGGTERLVRGLFPADRQDLDNAETAARRQAIAADATIRWLATQMLHVVLAATPHSIPLAVPPSSTVEGLRFVGEERLLVRLRSDDGERHTLAWSLDGEPRPVPLGEDAPPEAGDGHLRPKRRMGIGPEDRFPVISNAPSDAPTPWPGAQLAHDRAVRYFRPGLLLVPPAVRRPPTKLLGHRVTPTFLAFSTPSLDLADRLRGVAQRKLPTPRWLVSAGNGAPEDTERTAGAEIRLWPLDAAGHPPGHPLAHEERSLVDLVPEWHSVRADAEPDGPLVLDSPDGRQRARGHADGSVELDRVEASSGPDEGARSVRLHGQPNEGYAVRALAFAPTGRQLAVERQAVHAPYSRRVDLYDLDLPALIRRARARVGLDPQPAGADDGPDHRLVKERP